MTVAACRALVERGDPDRARMTAVATRAAQARLWPLYAFNLEIARAPWVTQEPLIAEMRLQWWRDVLEEIGSGMKPRAHEVVGPLALALHGGPVPVTLLYRMVAARRWDIAREPFADAAALEAHLDATAGNLMWAAALFTGAAPASEPVVRNLAVAAGLAAWFRAVPAYLATGRVPLPADAGELAQRGLARLSAARARRGEVAATSVVALLPAWEAGAVLSRVRADPSRVAAGRLDGPEVLRRAGLALRALSGRW